MNTEKLYITIDGDRVKLIPIDDAIQSDINAGKVVFELNSRYWSGSPTNLPHAPMNDWK